MLHSFVSKSAIDLFYGMLLELIGDERFGIEPDSPMYHVLKSYIFRTRHTVYDFVIISRENLIVMFPSNINLENVHHYVDLQRKMAVIYEIEQPERDLEDFAGQVELGC